jgi:hypothetical protein
MNDQTHDPKNPTALTPIGDGFAGYSDRVEGDEGPPSHGLFRGARLKFTNTAEWEAADGDVIDPTTKLIVTDVIRTVVKWSKEPKAPPEETRVIPPGQPFPDVEAMNNEIPREHWRPGINGPEGPWQAQHLVYLIEPRSMDEFTFVTSTVGGAISVGELVHKVKTMRRFRGAVSPIVTLGDAPMKTRFGERRRPCFRIDGWVSLGDGGGGGKPILPAPTGGGSAAAVIEAAPIKVEAAADSNASRITTIDVAAPLQAVKPVGVSEEMGGDRIPF